MPKKGSKEYLEFQHKRRQEKKEIEEMSQDNRTTPPFATSIMIFSALPQSYGLFSIIWNDN